MLFIFVQYITEDYYKHTFFLGANPKNVSQIF